MFVESLKYNNNITNTTIKCGVFIIKNDKD